MKMPFILPVIFIFIISCSLNKAQDLQADQIIFLNLKLMKGQICLESFKIVEGKLKRPKNVRLIKDHICYKVFTKTGIKHYEAVIVDPSNITYEYEDDQGQLRSKKVVLDSVNFSVRLPYDESIHRVEFYKITDGIQEDHQLPQRMQSIGSVIINLMERKNGK